jgi:methylase of polypeptide subunit release factors
MNLNFIFKGKTVSLPWVTENHFPVPKKIEVVDDSLSADRFVSLASQGVSFVWKGDFQNAKQLLQAVQRRLKKKWPPTTNADPQNWAKEFYRYRQYQAHKAQILSRLLVCVENDFSIQLPRAPDLKQALTEAVSFEGPFLVSLRELQGFVGAHEWRKRGVAIAQLEGQKIHAFYGVFSPVRGEYLDLLAQAPLPQPIECAFDIGTGTGVISAVLAHRGVPKIIATDVDDRALQCARSNIKNLKFEKQVCVEKKHLFPEGRADLIVCNPPWLPTKPTSAIERAVYDEDHSMLKSFLSGVGQHLNDHAEAWLIISDLAEHLGLRKPEDLTHWMDQGGLKVIDVLKVQPRHSKAHDDEDPLYPARVKEVTMLWRLRKL